LNEQIDIQLITEAVEEVVSDINNNTMASAFVNLGQTFLSKNEKYVPGSDEPKYFYDAHEHLKTFDAMLRLYNNANAQASDNEPEPDPEPA
jgi:hypothetical protein